MSTSVHGARASFLAVVALLAISVPAFAGGYAEAEARVGVPEVYVVQPGDTLGSIAKKFFGDSGKWRDLMEWNPHITDPNAIFPGQTIALGPASEETVTPLEPSSPIVGESELGEAMVDEFEEAARAGSSAIAPSEREARRFSITEGAYSYLVEHPVREVARIVSERDGNKYYAQESLVYINAGSRDELLVGDRLTIYRDSKIIEDTKTHEPLGYLYIVVGDVVLEQVDEQMSVARIKNSYAELNPGDKLEPYWKVPNSITRTENEISTTAKVIGVPGHKADLTERRALFLDKGARDGLKEGNVFTVYRDGKIIEDPWSGEPLREPREYVGQGVVFRVEENMSTAWVFESNRILKIGDVGTFE